MSDREDRKLREIPVATYQYRHEAEFAAGFLKDAGIPYRLQIDDPALGISMSTSAKIWVAAIDERRAREILQDDGALQPMDGKDRGDEDPDGEDTYGRMPARAKGDASGSSGGRRELAVDDHGNIKPDLTLRERLIALGGSVAVSSTLGIEVVREAGVAVTLMVALMGASLALAAVLGRAPGFLRRILTGLSGDGP